ncbi:hypothetical protein QA584_23250 [Anaerocolumna sp. AGMB13025]|uniref:hypothetical protein n=1 Tax=Anaerocolumna sp. AGMB13025 TaxID=3039116 RepID=UPI00241D099E|nr:hypothetical protein [Anaerocolumna sp. AGMB13025]WFR56500.1 hypothetical protein QA584_23250 [Anaerocolumna sp. AGMB13025]
MQNQKVNTGREAPLAPYRYKNKTVINARIINCTVIKIKLVVEIILNIIVNIVKIIVE